MTDGTSQPVRRAAWQLLAPTIIVALTAGIELAGRSVARSSLLQASVGADVSPTTLVLCAAALAIVSLVSLGLGRSLTTTQVVAVMLVCAFPAGMAAQLRLGARLQSDGFYYFAHLRSLWFDGDQDLTNDYRLLGMGDKAHLFTPTVTGAAQSAWTIGPAIVWSPFFAVGDRVASMLHASGRDVAVDGTSYPYRQSVCVAGLCWGLTGLFFCYLLAARFTARSWAAFAMVLVATGSFLLWYLVKEPTMTHAPSMAAVAVFTWAWASTRGTRPRWQWAALGLLAGFMSTIRWQNAIFALLPAIEWTMTLLPAASARTRRELLDHAANGVLFTIAAVVGFVPQMLVWKAIYGQFLAVSPIGPQIRWWHPRVADVLWSARNGLFATSPVLYVGALGLLLCWRRDRLFAGAALATFGAMVYFNASIQDWWGSAAFGGRRFDGTLPLLVVGTAVAAESTAAFVARAPQVAVALAGMALVIWNLTFMDAALNGFVRVDEPIGFTSLASRQAGTIVRLVGHPFSWPANLWFAWRTGMAPSDYDLVWGLRFLSDPAQPYGRVDLGPTDGMWLGDGWHDAERLPDGATFRWARETATLRLVLDHPATLRVQMRARAFSWPSAPSQHLRLSVNGRAEEPVEVPADWAVLERVVPAAAWRTGANAVVLTFDRATRPSDVGQGNDTRPLAAAVDYVRIVVEGS
jgi:hypothetical protein